MQAVRISLEQRLDRFNSLEQLEDMKGPLAEASTGVTFWGTRVVRLGSSTVDLDLLAKKFLNLASQCCVADAITDGQRDAGVAIRRSIKGFYENCDRQILEVNCFTKFLIWIRGSCDDRGESPRSYIAEVVKEVFKTYDKAKYEDAAGMTARPGRGDAGQEFLRINSMKERFGVFA